MTREQVVAALVADADGLDLTCASDVAWYVGEAVGPLALTVAERERIEAAVCRLVGLTGEV
jgi:hypothetical protein